MNRLSVILESNQKSPPSNTIPLSSAIGQKSLVTMNIYDAAKKGNFERVQSLVKNGADINAVDVVSCTPLHWACKFGHLQIVDFLAKKGARLDIPNSHGWSPLYSAIWFGTGASAKTNPRKQFRIVHYLVENGADIHATDDRDNSPLHLASILGNVQIVKYLVKHGADITARNGDGATPLHQACFSAISRLPVVQFLVQMGADITATDADGATPLDKARENGHTEVVKYLETTAKVRKCQALVLFLVKMGHLGNKKTLKRK